MAEPTREQYAEAERWLDELNARAFGDRRRNSRRTYITAIAVLRAERDRLREIASTIVPEAGGFNPDSITAVATVWCEQFHALRARAERAEAERDRMAAALVHLRQAVEGFLLGETRNQIGAYRCFLCGIESTALRFPHHPDCPLAPALDRTPEQEGEPS